MLKKLIKKILNNVFGYTLIRSKSFGLDIIEDIQKILPKKPLVIFDVGANEGAMSVAFATAFVDSVIHAFEPDTTTYQKLKHGVSSFGNIVTHNFGVGNSNQRMELFVNKGSGGNSFLKMSPEIHNFASGEWTENIGSVTAQLKTLNSFCQERNIAHINIIKIDTQGYEIPVLEGASEIVNSKFTDVVFTEALFVDLYSNQGYFHELYNLLHGRGFRLVGLYNCFRKEDSPYHLLWCDALFVSEELV
jgi:FkbM family methyltransferase